MTSERVEKKRKTRKSPQKKATRGVKSSARVSFFSGLVVILLAGTFMMTPGQDIPGKPALEHPKYRMISSVSSIVKTEAAALLVQDFEIARKMSINDRIGFWSEKLSRDSKEAGGVRKKLEILVRNLEVQDVVPLVPKAFDCTTFVETVSALARSDRPADFFQSLTAIRYKNGEPSFFNRNHFPEADWIPNNEKAEILTDITRELAQSEQVELGVEKKWVQRMEWLNDQIRHRKIPKSFREAMPNEWETPVPSQVSYIPLFNIEGALPSIPAGAIVNLVHREDSQHPVLISHQGFLIRKGNQVFLRHASTQGEVQTVDFRDYLRRIARRGALAGNWPLIGINVLQLNAPIWD